MLRKYCRRTAILILISLVLAAGTAFAAGTQPPIDFGRKGSITVTLHDNTGEHGAIPYASFTLYHAAYIEEGPSPQYRFTEAFAGCGISLDDIERPGLASELYAFAEEHGLVGTTQGCGETGSVTFEGLDLGLYLIAQEGSVPGYYPVLPFVVSVPMADPSGAGWIYEAEAGPKAEPEPTEESTKLRVVKVWQDEEGANRPSSVEVELLSNGSVCSTAELSEANNWEHTWEDLPGGNTYTVREKTVPEGYQVSYETGEYLVTVVNTAKMPQTGQVKWPVPVLALAGLILLTAGVTILSKRKER